MTKEKKKERFQVCKTRIAFIFNKSHSFKVFYLKIKDFKNRILKMENKKKYLVCLPSFVGRRENH